jgi:hypothetical protein
MIYDHSIALRSAIQAKKSHHKHISSLSIQWSYLSCCSKRTHQMISFTFKTQSLGSAETQSKHDQLILLQSLPLVSSLLSLLSHHKDMTSWISRKNAETRKAYIQSSRLAKDRMLHPIQIKTWLHTAFSCCIVAAVITLLVEEVNRYYQYLDYLHDTPSPVSEVPEPGRFLFLAIIFQMQHNMTPKRPLTDYWTAAFSFLWQNSEMTNSFTFCSFSTFQTTALLLTIMTQTMTVYGI